MVQRLQPCCFKTMNCSRKPISIARAIINHISKNKTTQLDVASTSITLGRTTLTNNPINFFPTFTIQLLMKLICHIPAFLRNKYFLTLSVFVVWMLFFDHNDLFTQLERRGDLQE